MQSLKFFLIGPPRIELGGKPLKLDARKNYALLFYLAVTGESHTRESLVTLLWPEMEPSRARAGLRRNLSVLRKALAGEWLEVDRETVSLNFTGGFWLDVADFQEFLASGQDHDCSDSEICRDCLEKLAEGVDLYRGDFLQGFSLRDSSIFDEWQFFQTQYLRQELASALEKLVRSYTALKAYEKAISNTRLWLRLDSLNEPAYRQLMKLFAWTGQRAAALYLYKTCERILKEELDVSPSEETLLLYQSIKSNRDLVAQDQRLTTSNSVTEITPRNNLPVQSTPFIGRHREIDELGKLLVNDHVRLVTILGAGGMGKTRLALETAASIINQFPQGVFIIPLSRLQSVESITSAVANVLEISFYDRSDPQQQLLETLQSKTVLLILDNFELFLEGSDWVLKVLASTSHVKILTTSRVKLNLQVENLFPIVGMEYPVESSFIDDQLLDLEKTAQYGAIQLFIFAARRVRPSFEPISNDLVRIIEICQLVQGMPLAILLAAHWIEVLTLSEIVKEIKKGLDFLEADLHDIPARQRSIQAVFDHSWRLLSERERDVFQALSIFRGGFTRDASSQIVGGSLRDLRALVNKSLLHHSPTGRYEIHELLRQFAADKFDESTSSYYVVREKHAAFYASFIQGQGVKLRGTQPQVILIEIESESANALLAWNWLVEQRQLDQIAQMIEGLFVFYLCRMRYQEGDEICSQAVEQLRLITAVGGLRILAKIFMWQGVFKYRQGFFDVSNQFLRDSLSLLAAPQLLNQDTRLEKAAILYQMGHTVFDHDRGKAMEFYAESLALYRELGDRWGTANALSALSWSNWSGGDYHKAKEMFKETLKIRQSLGDFRGVVDSISGMGQVEIFLGHFEEAERLMSESRRAMKEMDGYSGLSVEPSISNETLTETEELAVTTALYRERVGLFSDLGFSHSLAPSNSIMGFILKHLGRYEQARQQGEKGLALARQVGWRQEEGLSLEVLGEVALASEAYDEALDYSLESFDILKSTGQLEQYEVLAVLGYVYLGLNQKTRAAKYFVEALQFASAIPTIFPIITAIPGIALLEIFHGEEEKAVELYSLALKYPRVANSRWFDDIAGRHITVLAETLPHDAYAAAQARGQSHVLNSAVAEVLKKYSGL